MRVKLYHFPLSTPSRGALLAARAVGVPIEVEIVDLFKGEQLKENFVKINPQHCVPTLDDNGFILWESKAIACYLADKYGKDDHLYPKNLEKRALINQRLYFDTSSLLVKLRAVTIEGLTDERKMKRISSNYLVSGQIPDNDSISSQILDIQKLRNFRKSILIGKIAFDHASKTDLDTTLSFLDQFLSNSTWVAGDNYSIADTSIYATVSSIIAIGWDISMFPNIKRWLTECTSLPGYAENEDGAKAYGEAVRKNLAQQ